MAFIWVQIPQPPFTKISLKITYLKLNWNLPGANELTEPTLILAPNRWQDITWNNDDPVHRQIIINELTITILYLNTLGPRQNGRHFTDDIFKCILLNENVWISIKISLKFVPKGPINNIPALVQIMAWRLPGDKPLSEPMMVNLPTHICVTRPQWVNVLQRLNYSSST